ncbi:MAG: hypothetical protein QOI63_1956, partial [Thermoplasmata archaeon]|nr:hypothetical protein [Thermoplasmata archaeon]
MVGAFAGLALLLALATPAAATPADMIRPGHAPPPPADWAQAPEPESTVTADLSLHGGAIQKAPKVYLVFWGWHGRDPYGEAQQLYDFFSGIGGTGWAATQTQYYDNARGYITNPANQLGGYWIDDTSTPPSFSSFGDIMGEALRAEAHFGYDRDANYFVATPSGHSTNGFGTVFCAWHSSVKDSAGRDVAFTNFPYNLDTGNCGAYSVNGWPGGLLDGVTVVAGHEYAETVTDPVPPTGWHDGTTAGENADKCAWRFSGPGAMANLATSTGTFAVQGMWSNADHGCAIVGNLADLSAALTAPASVLPGFPLTYVATVANHGPHTATAASLVASLPAAFRFTHGTLSQGSCTASPDATVFLCSLGGLATGASATVTFTGTLPTPGAVRGTATAGTASLDLNPGNDAAAAATQVLPPSTDLRATASASTGSTLVGHAVVYMANVTNRGPSDASATTLALQLPPGTYGTLAVTQGSCTRVGMAVTCPLGALATGATASLTIP